MKKYALVVFLLAHCGSYIAAGGVGQLLFELGQYREYEELRKAVNTICRIAANDDNTKRLASSNNHRIISRILSVFSGGEGSIGELKVDMPQLLFQLAQTESYEPLSKAISTINKTIAYKNPPNWSRGTPGATFLIAAAQEGRGAVVELLVAFGADVNKKNGEGVSPLRQASKHGHIRIVKRLVRSGADIEILCNGGWSPLMVASQEGHDKVVMYLIRHGARVNVQSNQGGGALFLASQNGHAGIVAQLLKRDARQMPDNKGVYPLFLASQNGHTAIVNDLLRAGAEVNAQASGARNRTALHQAAQNGHRAVARKLLQAGADKNLRDAHGMTPLDLVCSFNRDDEVVRILRSE